MGSYDTGEVSFPSRSAPVRPRRRASPPAPSVPPASDGGGSNYSSGSGGGSGGGGSSGGGSNTPASNYDSSLKTIAALGGGLTPDRIVQPVPEEVRDGTLRDVVKYLTGDDVASRPEDRAVVEAVQQRMSVSNYRIIINETLNVSAARIEDRVIPYLHQKTQEGDDGPLKYNFVDIAIVSHDEGGQVYESLDEMLR